MEINRDIETVLGQWEKSPDRKPLLLRGARQVGKSFAVRSWAKISNFSLIEINFEEQPQYRAVFEPDLVVDRILDELSLLSGKNTRAPEVIIFLDEIQTAPKAITALRYFYERAPQVRVVAAGSLIEFVLQAEGFPVGRVQSAYMFPVTFFEFLDAFGKSHIRDYLSRYDVSKAQQIPDATHLEILSLLRTYFHIGGLPKVVTTFLETRDFGRVAEEQRTILRGYQDDFQKYAKQSDWSTLTAIFEKMGGLVGRTRVTFASVGKDFAARDVRRAIELLDQALVVSRVYPTHTRQLPLSAASSQKQFKMLFLDIGLLHSLMGFDWKVVPRDGDVTTIAEGRFAEQFVGQELIAARSQGGRYQLHYWNRPKLGSEAEVDYVIEFENAPCPIEVKSGVRGKLRSLTQYIRELQPPHAFVVSQRNREHLPDAELLPLYLAARIRS